MNTSAKDIAGMASGHIASKVDDGEHFAEGYR